MATANEMTELAEALLRTQARLISDDFLRFATAMQEADNGFDWVYFLEKPWKWSTAYAVWVEVGKPTGDRDPDDVSGWRRFLAALDA